MRLRFRMNLTQKKKISILLIDDHQLFNDGLKSLLSNEDEIEIVGQLFEAKQVLFTLQKTAPQLIFLDINLPDGNGIEIAKTILKEFPSTKIILLTMYSDYALLKEAQKIGVHGYMLKNSALKDLVNGIRMVINGKTYFDERIQKTEQRHVNKSELSKKYALTEREIEIIRYVRDGLDSYQIANKTSLSYLTIKTHRRNIHFKLGTNTTPELIKFAYDNGV